MDETVPAPSRGRRADWEIIEGQYRAGVKSIRAIAAEHGLSEKAIRKRAVARGWERDLSVRVKREVRSQLVRSRPPKPYVPHPRPEIRDAEAVAEAAATQIEVVLRHRRRIAKAHEIADAMMAELQAAYEYGEEIAGDIGLETADDKNVQRRDRMWRAIELPSRSSILVNLTNAIQKLIALERQAFCLDDGADPDKPGQVTKIERIVYDAGYPDSAGLPAALESSPV